MGTTERRKEGRGDDVSLFREEGREEGRRTNLTKETARCSCADHLSSWWKTENERDVEEKEKEKQREGKRREEKQEKTEGEKNVLFLRIGRVLFREEREKMDHEGRKGVRVWQRMKKRGSRLRVEREQRTQRTANDRENSEKWQRRVLCNEKQRHTQRESKRNRSWVE